MDNTFHNHFDETDVLQPIERSLQKVMKNKHLQPPKENECPHCASGGHVILTRNSVKYGREYGDWSWCYFCIDCRAYVGCHEFTHIPLGTLATQPVLDARKAAHAAFDPLWKIGRFKRAEAYAWLAKQLGIDREDCHISWFDVDMCNKVVAATKNYYKEPVEEPVVKKKSGLTLGDMFGAMFAKA